MMLKILFDTNIIFTYLTRRNDMFLNESVELVKCVKDGVCQGFIAFHSVSTLWYLLRKTDEDIRREMLEETLNIFEIAVARRKELLSAIQNKAFQDFEDAIIVKCAQNANCDFIVTANINDFIVSDVMTLTPNRLLEFLL